MIAGMPSPMWHRRQRTAVAASVAIVAVVVAAGIVYWHYGRVSEQYEARVLSESRSAPATADVITYYRLGDDMDRTRPSLPLPQAIQDVVDARGGLLKASASYKGARMLLFESFNRIDQTLGVIPLPPNLAFTYGVCGSDLLASKATLAKVMRGAGLERYLPTTYVLGDVADTVRLRQEWSSKQVYIVKKDVQRQEGVLLTTSLEDMLDKAAANNGTNGGNSGERYVVAQVVLQDPLLVGGRKVNMRVYLLVVADAVATRFFMYKDGFMYYTPKPFQPYTTDPDVNITTGYIDRQVYAKNPLTIQDLGRALGSDNFERLMRNTETMLKGLAEAYAPRLAQANREIPGVKFVVYGVDVAPDNQLGVRVMEVNKGPDLGYKDDRDKAVKHNMMLEAFARAGVLPQLSQQQPAMFLQLLRHAV